MSLVSPRCDAIGCAEEARAAQLACAPITPIARMAVPIAVWRRCQFDALVGAAVVSPSAVAGSSSVEVVFGARILSRSCGNLDRHLAMATARYPRVSLPFALCSMAARTF